MYAFCGRVTSAFLMTDEISTAELTKQVLRGDGSTKGFSIPFSPLATERGSK